MMKAFVDNFWLLGITFLAAIPLLFLTRNVTHHHRAPAGMD